MPTFEVTARFSKDFADLDPIDKGRFKRTVDESFVPDLRAGRFRPGLRVRGVVKVPGVYEMTWAPNGRATWEYGPEHIPDEPHVIWRRVGSHDIYNQP